MTDLQNQSQNLQRPANQGPNARGIPAWYRRLRIGPLGPMGLCAIAVGFIALLISGRLRMLYPTPRTVIASPGSEAEKDQSQRRGEAGKTVRPPRGVKTDAPDAHPAAADR